MARVFLVEAQPFDPATRAVVPVRLAGGGRRHYDHKGVVDWKGGVMAPPKVTAALGYDQTGFTGGAIPTVSAIGFFPSQPATATSLAALMWVGAGLTVSTGNDDTADPVWTPQIAGTVAGYQVQKGAFVFTVSDLAGALAKPLLVATFAGTGGAEGDAEATGRPKRRSWGRCFNVEGRVLKKASNIFEFGDPGRPIQSFDLVKDRGRGASGQQLVAWAGSVAATLAALDAVTPPAGGCAAAPSINAVKWWTVPAGPLTADVRGEVGAGYVETVAAIADRVSQAAGGPAVAALTGVDATRPDAAGLHVEDAGETAAAALDRLLLRASLAWSIGASGALNLAPIAFDAPVETVTASLIERDAAFAPVTRFAIGYRRNHRLHTAAEISAAVLAADVVLADGTTADAAIAATQAAAAAASVTLYAPNGGYSIDGGTITKTGPDGWTGTVYSREFARGDFRFSAYSTGNVVIGLSSTRNPAITTDFDYQLAYGGFIGAGYPGNPYDVVAFSMACTREIRRVGSEIIFLIDGVEKRRVAAPADLPLFAAVAIQYSGQTVERVAFGPSLLIDFADLGGATRPADGATADVTLVAPVTTAVVTLRGNTAIAAPSHPGDWASFARSAKSLTGGARVTASLTSGALLGLTTDSDGAGASTINQYAAHDYSIALIGSTFYINESGVLVWYGGGYTAASVPEIAYTSGEVVYSVDGAAVHRTPAAAGLTLWASVSFVQASASVSGLRFEPYADITARNTVKVAVDDFELAATSTGAIVTPLPATRQAAVTRGGVSVASAASTSYALANLSANLAPGGVAKLTVDSGGLLTLASGITGPGTADLVVTVAGVEQPPERVVVGVTRAPASGAGGGGGGTGKSGSASLIGASATDTTFVPLAGIAGLVVASGETISVSAAADYQFSKVGAAPGSSAAKVKWRYSVSGFDSWTDMPGGVATGSAASSAGDQGSAAIADAVAPAAGTYDVQLVGARASATPTGQITFVAGDAAASVA